MPYRPSTAFGLLTPPLTRAGISRTPSGRRLARHSLGTRQCHAIGRGLDVCFRPASCSRFGDGENPGPAHFGWTGHASSSRDRLRFTVNRPQRPGRASLDLAQPRGGVRGHVETRVMDPCAPGRGCGRLVGIAHRGRRIGKPWQVPPQRGRLQARHGAWRHSRRFRRPARNSAARPRLRASAPGPRDAAESNDRMPGGLRGPSDGRTVRARWPDLRSVVSHRATMALRMYSGRFSPSALAHALARARSSGGTLMLITDI